ncbi:unnamed protein product [Urochloa decumbens]|uniref:Purple acid phosphatase n=1 Tax=Urochloa decumbens TaxID=240449 RepID=A0ABC8XID4_9POAL
MGTRAARARESPHLPDPMAAPRLLLMLFLLAVSFSCAPAATGAHVVGEDYVRPPPARFHRKSLLSIFPWSKKAASASEPQQVHISLAGERRMRITWITDDNSVHSVVDYGTKKGTYTMTSQGDSTSYSYLLYSSGKIHHVVIGPLEDNTNYYYRCGGQGPEFQLKTPPSQFPLSLAVVGDLGQTSWTTSTLNHIKQCEHDMLLLPGDLAYADFMQHLWDSFGTLVEPLASTRPWMVTEGNHEKEHIPFLVSGFQSYNARWKMPYEESGSTSNLYYSFDVAGAHIIMLGSYTDYDESSDQYAWLKADLAKVDRKRTPWLIVLLHAPWYNSNWAHQGEGDSMMAAMETLLYAAHVDMVVAGHVHAYERAERVYNGRLDPCGAVHITIGDGGNREGLAHRNDDEEPVRTDDVWINSLSGSGCIQQGSRELRKILMSP